MARLSMLIDLTRCIGCDACTLACKQENGTPMDVFFARVLNIEAGRYPNTKRVYLPMLCYHCENPACLKACPNKAIFRRPDGVVLIDQDRCRGTGACVSACPYGNVFLQDEESWYLDSDERYEKDFVKPRLRSGVARKCTYCVHRVDEGLDPACVVACPTTARIFGDLDDEHSPISTYIREERIATGREPFPLLPEAGTRPAGCYLGPLAEQDSSTLGGRAAPERAEPIQTQTDRRRSGPGAKVLVSVIALLLLGLVAIGRAQDIKPDADVYATSSCMGCHGMSGMGGLGPPIVRTKLTYPQFLELVRKGKGMMPATTASELPDDKVAHMYKELETKPWDASQIPIAFKAGRFLSTRNVSILFTIVTLFALIFGTKVWIYWIKASAPRQLWPAMKRFGLLRSFGILVRSLIVDGFFVASLWRTNKFRWFMHGLMFYGFCGLLLGDILMQIFNPTRAELPFFSPLKMLPVLSGAAALTGVLFVMHRYRHDPYIDNGLTQGRDFLFLNLFFHTLISGFLTVALKRAGVNDWVMPVYMYHLSAVLLLLATAPFTRFAHVWVVPTMVAITKLTEAIVADGKDLGFQREPGPGRHHKSQRIATSLMRQLDPESTGPVVLRYYP